MQRVLISYYDQNVSLEPLLPRSGLLSEKKKMDGRDDWYVVTLDTPFMLPWSNSKRRVSCFVVASRWHGHAIEDSAGTSVFLLIPKDKKLPDSADWSLDKFDHIAWGMAQLIKEPNQALEPTSTAVTPPASAGDRASGTRGSS